MKLSLKRPDLNKQTKTSYFLLDNHNGLLNFILYIMTCIFVLYLDIQTFWHIMFMWFFFSAKNALLFSSTTVKKSIHPTLFWKDFLNMTLFCSSTTVRSGRGGWVGYSFCNSTFTSHSLLNTYLLIHIHYFISKLWQVIYYL